MKSKIGSLTPEQEAYMCELRDEWLAIGRSTEPLDRKKAEDAISDLYAAIDKDRPVFLWCQSPLQCMLTKVLLQNIATPNLGDNLWDNLWDSLWDNLGDNLWDNLRDNLRDNLQDNLWDNLWANLWENLEANLRANLEANLEANLWENLEANLRANLRANLWENLEANLRANLEANLWENLDYNNFDGSWWCAWTVFYLYGYYLGIPYAPEDKNMLCLWINEARYCHLWWPYDGIVILSERPSQLHLDANGRLHNEDGMSLEYGDGYGFYSWHGTTVPEFIIKNPERITIDTVFKEQNAEIRRIMMERYGFDRFGQELIKGGRAELIDERDVWGEPVKYYHYNDGNVLMGFIHVINGTTEKDGTKHEFILTVKADNNNAEEAVYSTYPELMKRLEGMPNRMEILKKSIRS